MARKKISRKKLLKEPDEFISTSEKVIQFIREQKRRIILLGGLVIVFIAAGYGAYFYFHQQEEKAQVIQQQALQIYQEAFRAGGTPEGGNNNYQKALKIFQESLTLYNRGNIAQMSQIYIGHCYYALKDYDRAITSYSLCLTGPFRAMAYDGLGYCFETKRNFAKALENYQKNIEEKGNPFQGEDMLGAARCYEALNQKEKALTLYQKVLDLTPKSGMTDFAHRMLSKLKG